MTISVKMNKNEFIIIFVLFCSTVGTTLGLDRSFLYPHGRGVPDKILPPQDDVSSPELVLKTPIVFYDDTYHSIFVSISFFN